MSRGSLFCSCLDAGVEETVNVDDVLEETPLLFSFDLGFSLGGRSYLDGLGGLGRGSNGEDDGDDDFLEHVLLNKLLYFTYKIIKYSHSIKYLLKWNFIIFKLKDELNRWNSYCTRLIFREIFRNDKLNKRLSLFTSLIRRNKIIKPNRNLNRRTKSSATWTPPTPPNTHKPKLHNL